jgi:hypothetical protein
MTKELNQMSFLTCVMNSTGYAGAFRRQVKSALTALFLASWVLGQALPGSPAVDNLGGGLAGVSGIPQMSASGMLSPGEVVVFTVDNAAPNALATLVMGGSIINLPIFGGVLIPYPDILLTTTTDSNGHAQLAVTWTEGLMTTSYWQWGAIDGVAIEGVSLSNALAVTGGSWELKSPGGVKWGKLEQDASGLSIKVTKDDGSVTSWAKHATGSWYEDGNGNNLTIGSGQPATINITGGQHQGAYTAH